MKPTRREFIIASTTAMCAVSMHRGPVFLPARGGGATTEPDPTLLEGDPYTAHVDECGLGGRTWEAAYEHALRFRSTSDDRDRYVLGLEV